MSKTMKFLAVITFVGIFALGFITPGFSQTSGVPLGVKGSNPSGDLTKSGVTATPTQEGGSSFGTPLGVKGSNPSGDLSKNAVPATAPEKSSSFGTPLGVKGSNPSGDLSTNATGGGK